MFNARIVSYRVHRFIFMSTLYSHWLDEKEKGKVITLACSRLRDSGEKSFSKKKCEKRAGAGESSARLIFALLVLIVRTILSESLVQAIITCILLSISVTEGFSTLKRSNLTNDNSDACGKETSFQFLCRSGI